MSKVHAYVHTYLVGAASSQDDGIFEHLNLVDNNPGAAPDVGWLCIVRTGDRIHRAVCRVEPQMFDCAGVTTYSINLLGKR